MDEKTDKAESAQTVRRRTVCGGSARLIAAAFRFEANGWYSEVSLRLAGLDGDTLRKARQSGKLRFARVGSEVFFKACWLEEWLAEGGGTQAPLAGGQDETRETGHDADVQVD